MVHLLRERRRGKTALFLLALAASAGLVSGCGQKPVATVNGQNLKEEEFHRLCESSTRVNPQGPSVGMQVLQQWIGTTLLAQEAKKQNVYPSDGELNKRVEAQRAQLAFAGQSLDEVLRQQGRSMDTFKHELLNALVMENVLYSGVAVSDAEIDAEFTKRKEFFTQPEQVRISQITVDNEKDRDEARQDLANNTDFKLVASTRSKDPFAKQGGQVPEPLTRQIQRGGPVAPEVVEAAFKLKPGQVSDPVKVGATWVFVRLDEKIEKKEPNLNDFRELIRASLRTEKAQSNGKAEENQRKFMQVATSADIKIHRPEYKAIESAFKAAAAGPTAQGMPPSMPPPPGG